MNNKLKEEIHGLKVSIKEVNHKIDIKENKS